MAHKNNEFVIRVDILQEINRQHRNVEAHIGAAFPESEALRTVAMAQYIHAVRRVQDAMSLLVDLQYRIVSNALEVQEEADSRRAVSELRSSVGMPSDN